MKEAIKNKNKIAKAHCWRPAAKSDIFVGLPRLHDNLEDARIANRLFKGDATKKKKKRTFLSSSSDLHNWTLCVLLIKEQRWSFHYSNMLRGHKTEEEYVKRSVMLRAFLFSKSRVGVHGFVNDLN